MKYDIYCTSHQCMLKTFLISLSLVIISVIYIEGNTIKSSLGFTESGGPRSNWAVYFDPRCPSSVWCITEYMAMYSGVYNTYHAVTSAWPIISPRSRVGAGRNRSARGCNIKPFERSYILRYIRTDLYYALNQCHNNFSLK